VRGVSNGPTLLNGIRFCAKCGGAMTLRTGNGDGGQYSYSTCSTKARQGKTGCESRSIRMDKLDHLVAGHLDRRQERAERRREYLADLEPANHGNRSAPQPALRRDRIRRRSAGRRGTERPVANLKAIRDQATADAERIRMTLDGSGDRAVTPEMIDALSETTRKSLRIEGGGYRRDHLRTFAQRVEVADDEVRIMGNKSDLLQTLVAASSGKRRRLRFAVLY
jgi:hypothetical protein